ncbi:response regulator transcription factor [Pseudovibrio sp. JE062]|uniref:response regulator transcription factor n=1 Tax=Pseudovibrio sp. JE062 TaxID=439495 RepID=UPI000186C06A|nr:response regulator transcription factor [Pseudovibrio sp. JE062]EEA95118.1 two-component response regulator [Pseudovibrio sp. JE062]
MQNILVVDDDAHIREVITFAIEKANYNTIIAENGFEAVACFKQQPVDLIILDIGMPEMDGFEVCREIRKHSEVPILFLSARDEEIDRILGLEMGGDDYVTKPFSPRELVARIGAILKRTNGPKITGEAKPSQLQAGGVQLDPSYRSVAYNGQPVELTSIEFEILKLFLDRPRMTFSRDRIIDLAYPPNIHVSDRTIDSHIRNVRSKLTTAGAPNLIETVHAVGFRLAALPVPS